MMWTERIIPANMVAVELMIDNPAAGRVTVSSQPTVARVRASHQRASPLHSVRLRP